MPAAAPSSPAAKAPREPLPWRFVRLTGIVILVGCVPLALLSPSGPKLIWGLVITSVPLIFTVAGYYAWRRICPLAFFATLGQRLKVQRKRKAGEWLAAHGLEVQLGLLVAALLWRHLAANSAPWALAGLFIAVVLAATAVGFLFTGKTWCNHLCPVGVVEKLYQEPVLLLPREGNSQCAACTACKKNCPDIDLEQAYWKELTSPSRRRVYYAWPGLVLAFYSYFYLAAGDWSPYFSGSWARDPHLASKMLAPGFFFAPVLPRLAAVPLTFLAFGLASFLAFALLERVLLTRAPGEQDPAALRHRCLSLAGFTGFILFCAFAGQSAWAPLPGWLRQALSVGVVMAATALLLARWHRSEATFVQEKFAKGLLKRWEWGDAPPSGRLSDIYLLHQERAQQREGRLKAYKATVRDLLAGGILTRGNLLLLAKLRTELGISEKDHDHLLAELSLEDQRLFDPDYQGSLEKQLQLDQYRGELEALLLGGPEPGTAAIDTLRQAHRIRPEEHARIMAELRGERGALVARLAGSVASIRALDAMLQATDRLAAAELSDAWLDEARQRRLAFFRHVALGRQRQHLEQVLHLAGIGLEEPRIQDLRLTLASAGPDGLREARLILGAMADQGALGAALAPLAVPGEPPEDPGSPLRLAAGDPSRYLRASALALLAYLPDGASEATLRNGLLDPEPLVRETAQTLLGVPEELDQSLSDLAENEEQWLLRAAVQSLPAGTRDRRAGQATLRHRGKAGASPAAGGPPAFALLERLMFLHGVPLFAQLEPEELEALAFAAVLRPFDPGAPLCRQGDHADEVFLILQGRVRTSALDAEGQSRSLGDSDAGACIGEMAVLDPAPRSATVTAQTSVLALILDGRMFREVLHGHPAVAEGVLQVLTRRLRSVIQGAPAS